MTCSPFDAVDPWQITLAPSGQLENAMMERIGMFHHMTATGPTPSDSFTTRPYVASFEMSYCTNSTGTFCDVNDPDAFEANAQTKYHYDVVAFPTGG